METKYMQQSFRTDNSKIMHHIYYHFVLTEGICLRIHNYLPKKIIFKFLDSYFTFLP